MVQRFSPNLTASPDVLASQSMKSDALVMETGFSLAASNLRWLSLVCVLSAASFGSSTARADFTGAYAPGNWTESEPGDSLVTFTGSTSLTIDGRNDSSGGIAFAWFTVPTSGTIEFDFSFSTEDQWGDLSTRYD